ncbi:MAG: hypothetical protein M0P08_05935 [Acholeplasmataceae bacterium]|nr:hypothetical protein [Acholeplasmataceae bacterium]
MRTKTYNITKRLSIQAKAQIRRILKVHDKYKNAYFMVPGFSSDNRRNREKKFVEQNPDMTFIDGDRIIDVRMSYHESARNVYYKIYVLVTQNGKQERKDVRVLRRLLQRSHKF